VFVTGLIRRSAGDVGLQLQAIVGSRARSDCRRFHAARFDARGPPNRETRREAVLGCWLLLRAANGPAFVRPSGPSLNEEKGGGELLGPRKKQTEKGARAKRITACQKRTEKGFPFI
jgi:hypothetical protein